MIKKEDVIRELREKFKSEIEELTERIEEALKNDPSAHEVKVDCSDFPNVVVKFVVNDFKDAGWEIEAGYTGFWRSRHEITIDRRL